MLVAVRRFAAACLCALATTAAQAQPAGWVGGDGGLGEDPAIQLSSKGTQ